MNVRVYANIEPMSAAALLKEARLRSGLSQAELARRAGITRSVVNVYERGVREPGADTLIRVLSAAGFDVHLDRAGPIDVQRNARILADVLDLAEHLPSRRRGRLTYPILP
jgi:transcriptional regulator with XRE-family HTH domain